MTKLKFIMMVVVTIITGEQEEENHIYNNFYNNYCDGGCIITGAQEEENHIYEIPANAFSSDEVPSNKYDSLSTPPPTGHAALPGMNPCPAYQTLPCKI